MKEIYLDSDEEKPHFVERPLTSALSLDDLQGIFYLSGLCFLLGLVLLFAEFGMKALTKKNPHKHNGLKNYTELVDYHHVTI